MSFWESRYVKKARKDHVCIYCGRTIKAGKSYYSEAGIYERRFEAYNFCERCHDYVEEYCEPGEFSSLYQELICGEIIECPECSKSNLRNYAFADDMMSCTLECDECDHKWVQDLSFEGIRRLMKVGEA